MHHIIRNNILKLADSDYVRSAIAEQADLAAFKEKPTPLILTGVLAIAFSFVLGWPAIAALGALSIHTHNPWLIAVGGPLTYALSHLVFLFGMYLSGAVYSLIFLRWLTRIAMEKLLVWANS